MDRVIITTGGTGGHIFPALAVAEEIRRRNPSVMLLFMGGKHGMEADIAVNAGLDFAALPVRGVMGRGIKGAGAACGMVRAVGMALGVIRKMKPQLVLGFGGYAAFAGVLAARMSGVRVAVHEQNAVPGMTNRLLGRLADRIFLSMPDMHGSFKPERCSLVGNPVRAAFVDLYELETAGLAGNEKTPAKSWYGGVDAPSPFKPGNREGQTAGAVSQNQAGQTGSDTTDDRAKNTGGHEAGQASPGGRKPRLLVVGGSQGAKAINDGLVESVGPLLEAGVEIWHQTGQADYERVRSTYRAAKAERVRVEPFIADMAKACAWADLYFGRAGASSVAELAAAGLPALFAPFPYATRNHQLLNARYLEEEGAATVLEQKTFSPPGGKPAMLVERLLSLLHDGPKLRDMALRSRTLAKPYAARNMVDELENIVGSGVRAAKSGPSETGAGLERDN